MEFPMDQDLEVNQDVEADYDRSIHSNPDAVAWAKFFMETKEKGNFEIDEALMIGWFANAMMAMYDHIDQQQRQLSGGRSAVDQTSKNLAGSKELEDFDFVNASLHSLG
jgi:hypothetical protein